MAGERVLIVEDDFLIRAALADALADRGFDVHEAGSGAAALELLAETGGFGLLVTDLQLGEGIGGAELVIQARALVPDLRVIVTTGSPGDASGWSDVVMTKPYALGELCDRAALLLRRQTLAASGGNAAGS